MAVEPSARNVDHIVDDVLQRLQFKTGESPTDIYVWADGTVTGPPDGHDAEEDDDKAIAVFSPDDRDTPRDAIRTTIARGLAVVDDA